MKALKSSLLAVAVVACSSKKAPEPAPTPAAAAVQQAEAARSQVEAQTGATVTSMKVVFVEPPEDIFVDLIIAGGGWAKGTISSRSIGVYQAPDADRRFRLAIEGVTQRFAFRPIGPSDYTVVCGGNAPSQTSVTRASAKCSMKYVDAVVAFHAARMTRDSGYVAASITRVPSGADRPETVYYCVTMARKGPKEWVAKHGERVVDANRCPRGWS